MHAQPAVIRLEGDMVRCPALFILLTESCFVIWSDLSRDAKSGPDLT